LSAGEIFVQMILLKKMGAAALSVVITSAAWAQSAKQDPASSYPSRPIRLVVPVPPGGSSDGLARIAAQRLTDAWGQQVLVDNRSGAAEIIGTDIVAKANPDGYTLVLVSLRYSVNPSLLKLPYDPIKDFEPVMMTAAVGNVLVVNSKTPLKSVKELIALARQKPGELTFASSGIGGAPHLIGEFFALQTNVKLTHIAYKGGGPAITDLVGGNVFMSFASMTSSLPFIKSGRLRPLAVSSKERSPQLPDVPTMGEAGVPNLEVRDWQGILGPRGTPKPVVDKLNAEIARILRHPDNQERLAAMGLEVIASTPEEFRKAIASEIKRWAKVVQEANIKVE
jgi:tripartite-type tricarboxylate transporter receptor subunit TctC